MDLKQSIERIKITRAARSYERKKLKSLFHLFDRAEGETTALRRKTGLKCVEGCGRCCENPYVETTVLEMLPLAIHLCQKNEGQELLDRPSTPPKGPCIFYKADSFNPGHGRCSIYSFRPLICRLYGYSAANDKYGKPHLITCQTIKKNQPQEFEQAEKMMTEGLSAPQMQDFSLEVFKIDPQLGKEKLPINIAIKIALEKVGLNFHYQKLNAKTPLCQPPPSESHLEHS